MSVNHNSKNIIEQMDEIKFVGCGNIRFGTALGSYWFAQLLWDGNSLEKLSAFFFFVSGYHVKTSDNPRISFLFSSSYAGRKDLERMFQNAVGLSNNSAIFHSESKASEADLSCFGLIPIWYMQLRKLKLSKTRKKMIVMYMYHSYVEGKRIFGMIQKYKKSMKLVVVFGDMFPIDNIVVQMCKKAGIPTASLQHGISNGTYHYIEYRCSVSDYLLAWGQYTRDIAIKFGIQREKIKILGPLTSINKKNEKCQFFGNKVFGVLTRNVSGKKYVDDNVDLISMANQFAKTFHYRYLLRQHPGDPNKYNEYIDFECFVGHSDAKKREETMDFFLNKVDFVICCNSTTFADALMAGKMAFRYIPKREETEDVCRGISFGKISDYEQLERAYLDYKKGLGVQINKVSKYIYESGDVAQNYRNFFANFS